MTKKGEKMQPVKKISIKSVVGNVKKIAYVWMNGKNQNKIKEKDLMVVLGVVGKVQTGENDIGEWVCFTGEIKAVNLMDKKEFSSNKAFLPEPALKMVRSAIEKFGMVEFAFKISIAESSKNKSGYSYIIESVISPQKHDPIKAIEKKIGDEIKQRAIGFKKTIGTKVKEVKE